MAYFMLSALSDLGVAIFSLITERSVMMAIWMTMMGAHHTAILETFVGMESSAHLNYVMTQIGNQQMAVLRTASFPKLVETTE